MEKFIPKIAFYTSGKERVAIEIESIEITDKAISFKYADSKKFSGNINVFSEQGFLYEGTDIYDGERTNIKIEFYRQNNFILLFGTWGGEDDFEGELVIRAFKEKGIGWG